MAYGLRGYGGADDCDGVRTGKTAGRAAPATAMQAAAGKQAPHGHRAVTPRRGEGEGKTDSNGKTKSRGTTDYLATLFFFSPPVIIKVKG